MLLIFPLYARATRSDKLDGKCHFGSNSLMRHGVTHDTAFLCEVLLFKNSYHIYRISLANFFIFVHKCMLFLFLKQCARMILSFSNNELITSFYMDLSAFHPTISDFIRQKSDGMTHNTIFHLVCPIQHFVGLCVTGIRLTPLFIQQINFVFVTRILSRNIFLTRE